MPPRRRKRIDPAHFELPVDRIRAGAFSDAYFNSSRIALRAADRRARVTWQLSAKRADASTAAPLTMISGALGEQNRRLFK